MGKRYTTRKGIGGFMSAPFRSFGRLNKNTKLIVVLVSILLLTGGSMALLGKQTNPVDTPIAKVQEEKSSDSVPSIKATLSQIEGVVEYRNELGEWDNATKNLELTKGMGLRTTGAASRAVVSFEDGSLIRLDAATEVSFDSLAESRVVIAQQSGNIYNRIRSVDGRDYAVQTEHAQFQSLGTVFRTIASGDEEAVEVYQSSVSETANNKKIKEGERFIAKNTNNPDRDGITEKLDLEKLKQDQFIVWNREQDLKNDAFKQSLGFLSDFDGPKIEITDPVADSSIEITDNSTIGAVNIKGKTEPKTKLTVKSKSFADAKDVTIEVASDGKFDTGILSGNIGTSVFEFTAVDPAGNKTIQTVSYTFKKKAAQQEQSITLSATIKDGSVQLGWTLQGITTPDGVKILYGDESGLIYKDAKDLVSSPGTTTSYPASQFTKEHAYFTVCRYNKVTNTCDIYSNEVDLNLETE